MAAQQWIGITEERFQDGGAVIHLTTGGQYPGEMWADG